MCPGEILLSFQKAQMDVEKKKTAL